jgi:hypothetical protein
VRPRRKPSGKPPTEEQKQRLLRQAGALAALTKHPSWPEIEVAVDVKEEKFRARLLAMAFSPLPVNQREIDYMNGYIHGMRWFLEVPENAESRLETYLQEYAQAEGAAS